VASLEILVGDWVRSLRAGNRSSGTVRNYTDSTTAFSRFLKTNGYSSEVGDIEREHVEDFIAGCSTGGSRRPLRRAETLL
jgi:hypothetical protein